LFRDSLCFYLKNLPPISSQLRLTAGFMGYVYYKKGKIMKVLKLSLIIILFTVFQVTVSEERLLTTGQWLEDFEFVMIEQAKRILKEFFGE